MEDLKNTIPKWVSLIYRYGQMYIGEQLKEYGIGKGQHIFLNALFKQDGLSQEELSDILKIDKGTTAKALKKLEAQGYVIRTVRAEDKRSYQVHLTDKAWQIKGKLREVLTNWRHILSKDFSEEEQQQALKYLEKMWNNVTRHIEEHSFRKGE
jgi:DNA-binding MarR family transcriptional regulator